MGEFADKVFEQVKRIPAGKVSTYGQIARLVGRPRSARYVGFALHANPAPGSDAESIPCHRVVFKDGRLCEGYAFGGPDVQRAMLEDEGVTFLDDGKVDMQACQWDPASSDSTVNAGDERAPVLPDSKSSRPAASEDEALPSSPPPDFDWARELGGE